MEGARARVLTGLLASLTLVACQQDPSQPTNAAGPAATPPARDAGAQCASDATYRMIDAAIADRIWPPELREADLPLSDATSVSVFVRYDRPAVDSVDRDTGAVSCSVDLVMPVSLLARHADYPASLDVRFEPGRLIARIQYGLQRQIGSDAPILRLPLAGDVGKLVFAASTVRTDVKSRAPQAMADENAPVEADNDQSMPDADLNVTDGDR